MSAATPELPFPTNFSPSGEPAWEVAYLFPTQGNWTEAEYLALDSNRLVELSTGRLEVLPVTTILHQLIVKFLVKQLEVYLAGRRLGMVLFAPLPVRLAPETFREPDIVYLRSERVTTLKGQPEGGSRNGSRK